MDDESGRARRLLIEYVDRMRGIDLRDELDEGAARLIETFENAGVAALLLKGPVLARVLYKPGEERMYSDVDILVDPAALERARALLRSEQWVCVQEQLGIEDLGGRAGAAAREFFHSEDWMLGPVTCDLHWRLPATKEPSETVWNALRASQQLIDLKGHRVATMSRVGLALHTAIHAAQHGGQHGIGLRDLELALARWPPDVWDQAEALAGEVGARDAFAAGLQLVPAGREVARRLALPDLSQLNWTPLEELPRGTYYLRAFGEADSLTARARVMRRALLPPSRWILWEYPWATRWRPLQVAAYTLHLVRAPMWGVKALRSRRRHDRASG